MRKGETRLRLVVCVIILLIFGSACQSAPRREPVSPRPDLSPPPSLSVEALDKRIAYLSRLLETQELSRQEQDLAQDLLSAYKALKTTTQSGSLKQDYVPMINILLRNLEQMEDRYLTKKKTKESFSSEGLRQLTAKRKKILEAFSRGNDQAVIDEILDLEKSFGSSALTPDLNLLYALSLGKMGTLSTALRVGQDATRQLERMPDLVQLRAQMLEWQIAMGNDREAKETLERLRRMLDEREALLKGLEQKLAPQQTKPALPDSLGPDTETSKAVSDRDLKESLSKANELAQKGDFEKAKFILFQQRIRFDEGPEAELIDQALKSVEMAEGKSLPQAKPEVAAKGPSVELPREPQREIEKQDSLKVALNLIRSEKYEEAILKLDELPSSDQEVKELRNTAVEKIINRERNRAAKLFLDARNTKDPGKKEEMLNSSYNILKAVADKYPSSPLIPKVRENMNQVTKELTKVKKGEG
jgi:hypothetical protein